MSENDDRFFVCISNEGYEASLETRKMYVGTPNTNSEKHGLLSEPPGSH